MAVVKSQGPGTVELSQVEVTLDGELRGSGDLTATMSGKRLLLKMSGPGSAHIDGKVDLVRAQCSGSGSLEGRKLTAGRADLAVSGPGSAAVNVAGRERRQGAQLLVVDRSGSRQSAQYAPQ